MIAGNQPYITFIFNFFKPWKILIHELPDISFSLFGKVALLLSCFSIDISGQIMVSILHSLMTIQIKIHMESCFGNSHVRLTPFCYQYCFRILTIHHFPCFAPQFTGCLPSRVIFDKAKCHIHAKTVTAHVQPKTHDIQKCLKSFPAWFLLIRNLPIRSNPIESIV